MKHIGFIIYEEKKLNHNNISTILEPLRGNVCFMENLQCTTSALRANWFIHRKEKCNYNDENYGIAVRVL